MDATPADEKPTHLPAYSAPPHHLHRPLHVLPTTHAPYDRSWPPYTPSLDPHHPPDPRHYPNPPPPLPAPAYPPNPSRQLPHPDAPYGRQNSLPAVAQTMGTPPVSSIPPMNGVPADHTPLSAPPEYRARKHFPSPEQPTNGDHPTLSIPHTQYPSPAPHFPPTPTYDQAFYLNQAGAKRKPGRAQQVIQHLSPFLNTVRTNCKGLCLTSPLSLLYNRHAINAEQGKLNATRVAPPVVIVKRTTTPVSIKRSPRTSVFHRLHP